MIKHLPFSPKQAVPLGKQRLRVCKEQGGRAFRFLACKRRGDGCYHHFSKPSELTSHAPPTASKTEVSSHTADPHGSFQPRWATAHHGLPAAPKERPPHASCEVVSAPEDQSRTCQGLFWIQLPVYRKYRRQRNELTCSMGMRSAKSGLWVTPQDKRLSSSNKWGARGKNTAEGNLWIKRVIEGISNNCNVQTWCGSWFKKQKTVFKNQHVKNWKQEHRIYIWRYVAIVLFCCFWFLVLFIYLFLGWGGGN